MALITRETGDSHVPSCVAQSVIKTVDTERLFMPRLEPLKEERSVAAGAPAVLLHNQLEHAFHIEPVGEFWDFFRLAVGRQVLPEALR